MAAPPRWRMSSHTSPATATAERNPSSGVATRATNAGNRIGAGVAAVEPVPVRVSVGPGPPHLDDVTALADVMGVGDRGGVPGSGGGPRGVVVVQLPHNPDNHHRAEDEDDRAARGGPAPAGTGIHVRGGRQGISP